MDMEQKHKEEMNSLQDNFQKVKESYEKIHDVYENKFKMSEQTYKQYTNALNKRTEYEKEVVTELKDRERSQMKTHYETIIHKYEKEFKAKI